ncbi:SIMPL domain-containing protein [Kovacikia minuta CCNUW1]|uniref:SIMPL domain-containing protein n=1 Tax=Kovacikia minuta TaxID=2931930 RepID=UPI001CCF921D|nr:SIMPL domain-containing protein [Kovacikia minuta]UBF27423.1 SIMPL domain-containing protein [Kovacikia minuta CCNUW1]
MIFPSFSALVMISFGMGGMQTAIANPDCQLAAAGNETIAATPDAQGCLGVTQTTVGRRSLTVMGQGQVKAPADAALLEFRFGSREESSAAAADAPGLSIQDSRKLAETALKPTVNALMTAGIPARNITVQTGSIQNPKLLVKVDKPTQDRLQQIVLTVDQSLKSGQQLFLQTIGAVYSVDRCEPLERSARQIALQDAKRQMTTLAQDVKVELGELLSVTVLPLIGSSASLGCGTKVGVSASPLTLVTDETTPPYNPSDKPEVEVRSQVSVTHAIRK